MIAIHRRRIESRRCERFARRRDRQRSHARHMRPIFRRDIILFAKALDFARDAHREVGGIEARDRADAADAVAGRAPELLHADAVRADRSYPRDDDSPFH